MGSWKNMFKPFVSGVEFLDINDGQGPIRFVKCLQRSPTVYRGNAHSQSQKLAAFCNLQ